MTELDYSVLDPLEPLDENKGVDYSVLEPLTPETRAKDKQQKDIAELTARKEALEGRIATVKDTPVPKPTSEMSALGWSNVPRMGGLETSLQKTQSELSEAENRDIFWDTVMFDDFIYHFGHAWSSCLGRRHGNHNRVSSIAPDGTARHEQHVLRHHYPTKSIQAQILLDLTGDTSQPEPIKGKGNRWRVLF